jgi:hypothetical protein
MDKNLIAKIKALITKNKLEEALNLYAGWVEHNASMDNEVMFVFDADGSNYEIMLKRGDAVW